MKEIKKASRLFLVFLSVVAMTAQGPAFAQNLPNGARQQINDQYRSLNDDATKKTGTDKDGTKKGTNPSDSLNTPSQNQSAVQSQDQNSSSSDISKIIGMGLMAAGTAMMASCCPTGSGCCSTGAMMMGMGLQGMAQSGANQGAADNHGNQSTMSQASDPYKDYNVKSPDLTDPARASVDGETKIAINQAKKYGVTVDPKSGKITLPNGKSFNTSDVGNAGAMASAGVSSEDFKKAMDLAKSLEKKAAADVEKIGAHTAAGGFESGGARPSSTPSSVEESYGSGLPSVERKPTSVAGMVRHYNGETIGVSGDDLFAMMARKYREKVGKDNFLSPESQPSATDLTSH